MVDLARAAPEHCGLALALPLRFEQVAAALDGGPYADYVGRGRSAGSARELWALGFEHVATAALDLGREARRRGVDVRFDATLADLAELFERRRAVTVVAHWRGPELTACDFRVDPALILDRLLRDPAEPAARLREGLERDWRLRVETAPSDRAAASRLAEALDRRLSRAPPLRAAPDGAIWHMDAATLRHMNRSVLDAWWPEAFTAGNRLELADGLHATEAIGGVVPAPWAGVADFSSCQSAQLADAIKDDRADRIVISNERETSPIRRMGVLALTYELLSAGDQNYAEVRASIARRLSDRQ